jgi:hypothetical protein
MELVTQCMALPPELLFFFYFQKIEFSILVKSNTVFHEHADAQQLHYMGIGHSSRKMW